MQQRYSWLLGGSIAALLAAPAFGVTWTYVGSSGFTAFATPYPATGGILNRPVTGTHAVADTRRVKVYSLVVDPAGNVFGTASRNNNRPGNPGGVTMWPAGGGPAVNFDVSNIGTASPTDYRGGWITKLVVGGDGKVYGVQNWYEFGTIGGCVDCSGTTSRLLRFNTNGTVDVIIDYTPRLPASGGWANRIGGLAAASDGHVYYWLGGPTHGVTYDDDGAGPHPAEGSYFKRHVLWRYNIFTQVIEESPTSNFDTRASYNCNGDFNEGFEQVSALLNLEWIGKDASNGNRDYFGIVYPNIQTVDRKSWLSCRESASNTIGNDQRHRFITMTAFDPIRQKLWIGDTGAGGSGIDGYGSTIFVRFNGTPNTGLFTTTDLWHANGNFPGDNSPFPGGVVGNGANYWISSLAVNIGDGRAWMSYSGHISCTQKPSDGDYKFRHDYAGGIEAAYARLGHVYTAGANGTINTDGTDEGRPQAALASVPALAAEANNETFVVGVAFGGNKVYAMTLDVVNGKFHLFQATNPGPSCNSPWADADADGDVDMDDYGVFQRCYTGPSGAGFDAAACFCFDRAHNNNVDDLDFTQFTNCATGANITTIPGGCQQ